jgi:hypothetical protein
MGLPMPVPADGAGVTRVHRKMAQKSFGLHEFADATSEELGFRKSKTRQYARGRSHFLRSLISGAPGDRSEGERRRRIRRYTSGRAFVASCDRNHAT